MNELTYLPKLNIKWEKLLIFYKIQIITALYIFPVRHSHVVEVLDCDADVLHELGSLALREVLGRNSIAQLNFQLNFKSSKSKFKLNWKFN